MFLIMPGEMMAAFFGTGFCLRMSRSGSSVANAREPKESMIRFMNSNYKLVNGDIPTAADPMKQIRKLTMFIVSWYCRNLRVLHRTTRPHLIKLMIVQKLSSSRTTSDYCLASSVPVIPSEIATLGLREKVSAWPSPVAATTSPASCSF